MKQLAIGFTVALVALASFFVCEYALYIEYRGRAIDVLPAFNQLIQITAPLYLVLNTERYRN